MKFQYLGCFSQDRRFCPEQLSSRFQPSPSMFVRVRHGAATQTRMFLIHQRKNVFVESREAGRQPDASRDPKQLGGKTKP